MLSTVAHLKNEPFGGIAFIFDLTYKLAGIRVALCDLFDKVQGIAIVLKVKEKLEILFTEYWQLYKPLTHHSE